MQLLSCLKRYLFFLECRSYARFPAASTCPDTTDASTSGAAPDLPEPVKNLLELGGRVENRKFTNGYYKVYHLPGGKRAFSLVQLQRCLDDAAGRGGHRDGATYGSSAEARKELGDAVAEWQLEGLGKLLESDPEW